MISEVSPVKLKPIKKAPICASVTEPLIINEKAMSASVFVISSFLEILDIICLKGSSVLILHFLLIFFLKFETFIH